MLTGIKSGEHPPVNPHTPELTQLIKELYAAKDQVAELKAQIVDLKASIPAAVAAGVEKALQNPQLLQQMYRIGE